MLMQLRLFTLNQYRLVIGLLLSGCFLTVAAQEPEPQSAIDTAPAAELEAAALETSLELDRYTRSIQDIESSLGIYSPALVEAYSDLGTFYFEIGDYEQAANVYRQALQVARINSGLKSENQLPVIDQIISSSVAQGDWQSTDDMHHLRFYVKNQILEPSDPRFVDAIDEMGRWKLRALRENLLGRGYRNLTEEASDLSELYQDGIARVLGAASFSETSLLPLYQGKSLADIEIARYLASTPYQYFKGTVNEFIYQRVCNNVRDAQGNIVRNCYSVRRENPRYRQSQQDAKRLAVYRSVRAVEGSIDNLNTILASNNDIPPPQREEVTSQIRQMQVEFDRITRDTRRRLLF